MAADSAISKIRIEKRAAAYKRPEQRVAFVELKAGSAYNNATDLVKLKNAVAAALDQQGIKVDDVEILPNSVPSADKLLQINDLNLPPGVSPSGIINALHEAIIENYVAQIPATRTTFDTEIEAVKTAANAATGYEEFRLVQEKLEADAAQGVTDIEAKLTAHALTVPPTDAQIDAFVIGDGTTSAHGIALKSAGLSMLTSFNTITNPSERATKLATYDTVIRSVVLLIAEGTFGPDVVVTVYKKLLEQRAAMLAGVTGLPAFTLGDPLADKTLEYAVKGSEVSGLVGATAIGQYKGKTKALDNAQDYVAKNPRPALVNLSVNNGASRVIALNLGDIYDLAANPTLTVATELDTVMQTGINGMANMIHGFKASELGDFYVRIVNNLDLDPSQTPDSKGLTSKIVIDRTYGPFSMCIAEAVVPVPIPTPFSLMNAIAANPIGIQYKFAELKQTIKKLEGSSDPKEKLAAIYLQAELDRFIADVDANYARLGIPINSWEAVKALTGDGNARVIINEARLKSDYVVDGARRRNLGNISDDVEQTLMNTEEELRIAGKTSELNDVRMFRINAASMIRQMAIFEKQGVQARKLLEGRLDELAEMVSGRGDTKLLKFGEAWLARKDVVEQTKAERAMRLKPQMEGIAAEMNGLEQQLERIQKVREVLGRILMTAQAMERSGRYTPAQLAIEIAKIAKDNAGMFEEFQNGLNGKNAVETIGDTVIAADIGNREYMQTVSKGEVKKKVAERKRAEFALLNRVERFGAKLRDNFENYRPRAA
jgi:hypothetical protein